MTEHATLAAALAAVQAELPRIGKGETATVPTKSGGSYSYSYANLADVTHAILPLLGRHGLSWTAKPTVADGRFGLAYRLMHASGESDEGLWPLPDPTQHSPQTIGSVITYARRYALQCATGIAPDEDDDAQQAQGATAQRPAPDPSRVRDWVLESERTANSLDQAARRLMSEHPAVAAAEVTNEVGEPERLSALMARRARELEPADAAPAYEVDQPGEERRRRRMFALYRDLGMDDRDNRLAIAVRVVGREITSTTELAWPAEVESVISALEARQKELEGATA